jgi:primosomal replication protein N
LQGDDYRVRAFLAFAAEEAKHIHLFKHFRAEFENGFGTECLFIGPPSAIAEAILAHDPLAVTLVILHIEWMTQKHYTESVQDDRGLDAQFKNLLKHHWMEEAQHAKLDTLMIEALAEGRGEAELDKALDEYLDIGGFLDNGLRQQAEFNLENLRRSTGRMLTEDERAEFVTRQHQALRWTFLGSGMTHENFLSTLERLSPALRKRLEQVAPVFC